MLSELLVDVVVKMKLDCPVDLLTSIPRNVFTRPPPMILKSLEYFLRNSSLNLVLVVVCIM